MMRNIDSEILRASKTVRECLTDNGDRAWDSCRSVDLFAGDTPYASIDSFTRQGEPFIIYGDLLRTDESDSKTSYVRFNLWRDDICDEFSISWDEHINGIINPSLENSEMNTCAELSLDAIQFDERFLSYDQRSDEFEYLFNILSNSYPFFEVKKRLGYEDWRERRKEWRRIVIGSNTPDSYYNAINSMVSGLHSNHAWIVSKPTILHYSSIDVKSLRPHRNAFCRALSASAFWTEVSIKTFNKQRVISSFYLNGQYLIKEKLLFNDGAILAPGAVVSEINDMSVHDFVNLNKESLYLLRDSFSGQIYASNVFAGFKEDEAFTVTIEGKNRPLMISADTVKNTGNCFTHRTNLKKYFYLDLLPEQIGYVKVNSLSNPGYSVEDVSEFKQFIDKYNNSKAVILDMRGNGGGDSRRWQRDIVGAMLENAVSTSIYFGIRPNEYLNPFIAARFVTGTSRPIKITKSEYPVDVPPEIKSGLISTMLKIAWDLKGNREDAFKPKVYLLVDRDVYSSAEMFVAWAKQTGWAVIVGEQTGGDGIGVDPVPIVLPHSRIAVSFPWIMGMFATGAVNEEMRTMPDIISMWNKKDWGKRCAFEHSIAERGENHEIWNVDNARKMLLENDPDILSVLKDLNIECK